MTAHTDFPLIQRRLAGLGLYPGSIDDEWGPGMLAGVSRLLADAERVKGIEAPTSPKWPGLPASYSWLHTSETLPRHLTLALDLYGTVETAGTANSATIMGWRDELRAGGVNIDGYTADSVPWCGLFIAYVMHKVGRQVVDGPLWALNWGKFGEDGGQPELGDVLTFKRPSGGHVAFYIAEDREGHYHILGGNQSDRVNIMRIAKSRMVACRQPPYQNKPVSVRPRIVSATGVISRNEA